MQNSSQNSSGNDKNAEISEVLEKLEPYILSLAKHYIPRDLIPIELIDMEIDEIAQITLIKLWHALSEERVQYIMPYTRTVVRNECINLIRKQQHKNYPLPLDNEGEISVNFIIQPGQETQNPAEELEQREVLIEYTTRAVHLILKLPRRQRQAMIAALKERVADILLLQHIFSEHGVDITTETIIAGKKEKSRLQASLSIAQKKLRAHKNRILYHLPLPYRCQKSDDA
jgi:RNA polymerase sigma factor (sigma-70 family)